MSRIFAILAAGNTLIAVTENEEQKQIIDQLAAAIKVVGTTDNIFRVVSLEQLNMVLNNKYLAGVIVDTSSDWQGYLAQVIAQREGEILPVICEADSDLLFYRLVTEKTVSIDTTAAGGNASLMTMAEEGMLDS